MDEFFIVYGSVEFLKIKRDSAALYWLFYTIFAAVYHDQINS